MPTYEKNDNNEKKIQGRSIVHRIKNWIALNLKNVTKQQLI